MNGQSTPLTVGYSNKSRKLYKLSKTLSKPKKAELFVSTERDWLLENDRPELTANERRVFVKRSRESDWKKLPVQTKKMRPWGT